jgi:polyisoprenoid-binding protein YceI
VTDKTWVFDASSGQLIVKTGVTGRAKRMGHRLTIAMNSWQATVSWAGDEPSSVELHVDVGSLEVLRGEGGVTPLSGPQKALARASALKSLTADRFPAIRFQADDIAHTADGYRLTGGLEIRGRTRPRSIDVRVVDLDDTWQVSCDAQVRQSEFGVKPYSMFIGSMKVADDVSVSCTGSRPKDRVTGGAG